MKSKVKFAAMTAVEIAAVATLAACGGGAGADASNGTDMTAQRVRGSTSGSLVTLTVASGQGGVVQSSPYGLISCTSAPQSSTCSTTVSAGTAIALTETPLTGYVFAGMFYFIFCYGMSRYSRNVELRLARRRR